MSPTLACRLASREQLRLGFAFLASQGQCSVMLSYGVLTIA